jgi:hypothetical protein
MLVGLECEYLLVDAGGPAPGRIRDFSNLSFAELQPVLERKPGRDDGRLATGDLGIKSGYWYIEGDERFHEDGRFNTLAVKGVEIRTPPLASVEAAIDHLLQTEIELGEVLGRQGLALGLAGFNPVRPAYDFDPPLNPWEQALRHQHRAYDGSRVSTLSYGPDVNLSFPEWSPARCLDVARKLNAYAPWIVPFSFSSPFVAGRPWFGFSKRTWERSPLRPAVKLYRQDMETATDSCLLYPARLPGEDGRLEFKAFDAFLSREILTACCHLLVGICLDETLPLRSETADVALYRRGALNGFADGEICLSSSLLLERAEAALSAAGDHLGVTALEPLRQMLAQKRTPARDLLRDWYRCGALYKAGGYASALRSSAHRAAIADTRLSYQA